MTAAPEPAETAFPEGEPDARPGEFPADLLVSGLERYEAEGAWGLAALCRAHPRHAAEILQRMCRLADLGLLPDPPVPGFRGGSADQAESGERSGPRDGPEPSPDAPSHAGGHPT